MIRKIANSYMHVAVLKLPNFQFN